MATTKSVQMTALDTAPRGLLEAATLHGKVRIARGTVAVAAADFDADGDIVTMVELPSHSKIVSIMIRNDDLDGATASVVNVGLYAGGSKFETSAGTKYAADGLIDEDAYASLITTLQAANTIGVDLAFEARDINLADNFIWEDAGLPEDPTVPLRIALTQTATVASAQAGDVTLVVMYVVD